MTSGDGFYHTQKMFAERSWGLSRAIAFGRFPTTEERKWGDLVGVCPRQITPNTLFAGLRLPLRAYAIALGD